MTTDGKLPSGYRPALSWVHSEPPEPRTGYASDADSAADQEPDDDEESGAEDWAEDFSWSAAEQAAAERAALEREALERGSAEQDSTEQDTAESSAPEAAAPEFAAPEAAAPGGEANGSARPTIGTFGTTGTGGSVGSTGGRHARRHGSSPSVPGTPRLDYVPRHAVDIPGAAPVSATDVTEVLARVREDPTERPRSARPESDPARPPEPERAPEPAEGDESAQPAEAPESTPGKRVRVVLSQRKGQARPVRTVVDVQELTQVGEVLSTSLIRSQLSLALRIGGIALLGLGVLPAAFYLVPDLGRFELFGIRLPWLLLGGLAYPFMVLLGWMYTRSAEKLEQIFADHIQS